jgi:hypothetical protein
MRQEKCLQFCTYVLKLYNQNANIIKDQPLLSYDNKYNQQARNSHSHMLAYAQQKFLFAIPLVFRLSYITVGHCKLGINY